MKCTTRPRYIPRVSVSPRTIPRELMPLVDPLRHCADGFPERVTTGRLDFSRFITECCARRCYMYLRHHQRGNKKMHRPTATANCSTVSRINNTVAIPSHHHLQHYYRAVEHFTTQ